MRASIKKKITISIAITTLIASILVAIFTFNSSVKFLHEEAKEKLKYINESYANSFDGNFKEVKKVVDTLTYEVSENIDYAKIKDPEYIDCFIEKINPIVKSQAQNSNESKSAYVFFNPKLTNSTHDVYYSDSNRDGIVIRQEPIPIDYYLDEGNNSDKYWWFVPVKTKKDYWTNPYCWNFPNGYSENAISYLKPIYNNDELICVVGSDFTYEKMKRIISKIKVYKSGYAFLLNGNLDVLVHPKFNIKDNVEKVNNGSFKTLADKMKNSDNNVLEYKDVDGTKKFISYNKLSNGWIMGISVKESEVLSSLYDFQYFMCILVFIIILILIIFSIMVGKLISNPIVDISNVLKDMDYSKLSINMPRKYIDRDDEIGTLSKAIDVMNLKLQESFQKISEKNTALKNEINQRKELESRLQLTFKILSNSEDGIFITDKNFKVKYFNKAFTKITGYTEMDVRTNRLNKSGIKLNKLILKELKNNRTWSGETIQVKKNEQTYPQYLLISKVNNYKDYYMGIFRDLTEHKLKEQDLEYLKNYDYLTKLLNKESFKFKVMEYINKDNNTKCIAAFVIIDLDNFTVINEALSFEHGNLLLIEISNRMQKYLDESYIIARTDGDEFSVFITNVNKFEELQEKIDKIVNIFNKPFNINKEEIFANSSVGISVYPTDSINYEGLLKNSTLALSYLKLNKKKPYEFYYKHMNEITTEKYELLKNLRYAIEKKEFILCYQPQIDIEKKCIIGVEALIRWNSSKGIIPPGKFIPLAEESGLIIPIGEWVLRKSCEFGYKLFEGGHEIIVGINISGAQFKEDYLIETIKDILQETKLPPRLLEVEITEGMLLENKLEASTILSKIRELGIRISIDDFGTGYSSLSYLKEFNVDKLKIDRSFVKDIPQKDDGTIANIIIQLSKHLNIKVIAEGIETKEQLEFIKEKGCSEIQGYYFSKPLKEEELIKFIEQFDYKNYI